MIEQLPISSPQPLPQPLHQEPSDSEDEEEDPRLDIDEQSDDEDERQAHALLRASPNQVILHSPIPQSAVTTVPRLSSAGRDHSGFAVSGIIFIKSIRPL